MADERPQLPDFYAVLGVGFDATEAELRSAWRTAVKQWHPDINPSPEAHSMMTRINEAWEVLGNPERRAEYDTLYFTMRAALANEERKQREEERLERERRERLRRQEQERKRREEERRAAAERREKERQERLKRERERRRAENEKREKERQEREQRERLRREAEERRKADLERRRREQERIEKERREQQRQEDEARQKSEGGRESRGQRGGFRKVPFWVGFVGGIALSALIAVAIVILLPQLEGLLNQDQTVLVETAGWGTIRATGDGSIDCSASAGGVRNVAAVGEFPSVEASFLTPDVKSWSAGFLYHSSAAGYSIAAVRRSGENFVVVNWTRVGLAEVANQEARFRSDLLHSSHSKVPNTLRMEMSDIGVTLFVNDVALAHVPRHDLRPTSSAVHFCAGIFSAEPTYTLQFIGLRGTVSEDSVVRGRVNGYQHWPPTIPVDQQGRRMITTARVGSVAAASTGTIDCSSRLGGPRNEVASGETFAAEADISVPVGTNWSIGFLYHVSESGYSVALVRRRASTLETLAWTQERASTIGWRESKINPDLIRPANSDLSNILRIEVSETGATFVLNEAALAHVPPSELRPNASDVHFCAGFFDDEPPYTVRYSSLRGTIDETVMSSIPTPRVIRVKATPKPTPRIVYVTATPRPTPRIVYVTATPRPTPWPTPVPFPTATPGSANELTHRGAGTLHQDVSDGFIGCPEWTSDPAYLSSNATSGSIEFSFDVPVASNWSIGLLYHNRIGSDNDAATYVFKRQDNAGVRVGHWTRVRGDVVDSVYPVAVLSGAFDSTVGSRNKVAIRTDHDGTEVKLNGRFALKVPVTELRPRAGTMEVCVGFLTGESEDYSIDYTGLRAWSE